MPRYFLDLFTPETWAAFCQNGADVSGFRQRQAGAASLIEPGDVFVCYLTRLSRWCGALTVRSAAFTDDTPIFADPDPFTVRFKVEALVLLPPEQRSQF